MLALRICSSSKSGKTDEKQRTRRCSRFCICSGLCIYGRLCVMEQRWTFFREIDTRDANIAAKRIGGYACEKIPKRFIAIGWLVGKSNLLQIEILEQPTQTLVLDSPGKSAATHHPGINSGCFALHPAKQNGNLAKSAIFIVVADCHQKSVPVVEIRHP